MSLQHPARVGHGVTHGASAGQIALGVGGAIVGGAIALFFLPEEAVGAVAIGLAAAGGASYGIELGQFFGKIIDKMSAPSVAGHIVTGFKTVHLGPAIKDAARAHEDTTADCAGEHVGWEGSDIVFLGNRPMSRIGDRLKCQGKICEGEETIVVGGNPSQEGKELEEATNPWVKGITLTGDGLGIISGKGLVEKGLAGLGFALDATDAPGAEAYGQATLAKDTYGKYKEISEGLGEGGIKNALKFFK